MKLGPGRRRTLLISTVILAASLGLFGVGIGQIFRFARPPVYRLHMVTDTVPNRQILARRMASEAHKRRLEIELTARSYPSLEVLRLVDTPNDIDLAMVPGGVGGSARFPNLRQVAALGTDPLHVMVRPELYESASRSLAALRGKRINCGPPASVLRVLVEDVLRFAGLTPPTATSAGDYRDASISSPDLVARLDAIRARPPDERAGLVAELGDQAPAITTSVFPGAVGMSAAIGSFTAPAKNSA